MIDTHAHIDDIQYQEDFPAFIAEQKADGVEAIVVPGINAESCDTVLAVCNSLPGFCYPALGLHPEEVKADWQEQLGKIEAVMKDYKTEFLNGTTVSIKTVTRVDNNAVTVPMDSVYYDDDQAYVFISEGGKAVRRDVETGISDDDGIVVFFTDTTQNIAGRKSAL